MQTVCVFAQLFSKPWGFKAKRTMKEETDKKVSTGLCCRLETFHLKVTEEATWMQQ